MNNYFIPNFLPNKSSKLILPAGLNNLNNLVTNQITKIKITNKLSTLTQLMIKHLNIVLNLLKTIKILFFMLLRIFMFFSDSFMLYMKE
jgi:hypothetical protein